MGALWRPPLWGAKVAGTVSGGGGGDPLYDNASSSQASFTFQLNVPATAPTGTTIGEQLLFAITGDQGTLPTITPSNDAAGAASIGSYTGTDMWIEFFTRTAPVAGAGTYTFGLGVQKDSGFLCLRIDPAGAFSSGDTVTAAESAGTSRSGIALSGLVVGDLLVECLITDLGNETGILADGGAPTVLYAPGGGSTGTRNTLAVDISSAAATTKSAISWSGYGFMDAACITVIGRT